MDWNSRRLTGIIENALLEDRATSDASSYACIDPNQRGAATIIAKQDCILAGLGCVSRILDVYAMLDGAVVSHHEVISHPEMTPPGSDSRGIFTPPASGRSSLSEADLAHPGAK